MLRFFGILFSALIVASVAIPWVSGPQIGVWSPVQLLKNLDLSRLNADQIRAFFNQPLNGDPINATPWALAAFGLSFPLAALFTLIGLLGYYSKPMALLMGALPIAVAGFAYYAFSRAQQSAAAGADLTNALAQLIKTQQVTFGYGAQIYVGAAALLALTAIFAPSRRRR